MRQYYVATSTANGRIPTLIELLSALAEETQLAGLVVCCNSRDSLDEVVSSLLATSLFSVTALHSDVADVEGCLQLFSSHLKQLSGEAGPASDRSPGHEGARRGPNLPAVLVSTDVCLKTIPPKLLPLGVPLLVGYDLPRTRDIYFRRISTTFGGGKERRLRTSIAISFVSAPEVAHFRQVESWLESRGRIEQMPVHVADVFA